MSKFAHTTDDIEELGFISKQKLLEYVTEEDIFELVFKFKPVEFEYITSPLRIDTNPGCWFETDITTGKLMFRDFGRGDRPLDCFDVVQQYFNLPNFYKTLDFVKKTLLDKVGIQHDIKTYVAVSKRKVVVKNKIKILVKTKPFTDSDRKFWQPLEITKEQLIEDKVFPISMFKMLGTKKGDITIKVNKPTYAYTDFEDGQKKIYQPYKKKKFRFSTNCDENAVGGINKLVPYGRQLLITKSYKDYRVLKNQGLNVVWFQNEGMIPSLKILSNLIERFDKIIVFFDNDNTGIEAANKVVNLINSQVLNKARQVHLDVELVKKDITDPADLMKQMGKSTLIEFLKFQNIK
jgi:hypothetical protein